MAKVTVVPRVVKTRVIEDVIEEGSNVIELSTKEMEALRTLLYTGVSTGTLVELGLDNLSYSLTMQGVDYQSPKWHHIANLQSVEDR